MCRPRAYAPPAPPPSRRLCLPPLLSDSTFPSLLEWSESEKKMCRTFEYGSEFETFGFYPSDLRMDGGRREKRNNLSPRRIILFIYFPPVSGIVRPGELLAIMGGSGAGKTTLLNVLTARHNSASLKLEGVLTLNGRAIKPKKLAQASAYVQQDDLFIGALTVEEHLRFRVSWRQRTRKTGWVWKCWWLSWISGLLHWFETGREGNPWAKLKELS